MPTKAKPQDQLELDAETIDDPELERALEDREKRKASKAAVTREYREADEAARGLINGLDVAPGVIIRCGRFRITRTVVAARSVAFETEATQRLTISAIHD